MCNLPGITAGNAGVSTAPFGTAADVRHKRGSINEAAHKGMRVVLDHSAKDLSLFNSALFKRSRASLDDGSMSGSGAENARNKSVGKLTVSILGKFDAKLRESDTKLPVRIAENGPKLLKISKIEKFDHKPKVELTATASDLQKLLEKASHSRSLLSPSQEAYLSLENGQPQASQLSAEEEAFLRLPGKPPTISQVAPSAPPIAQADETIEPIGNDVKASASPAERVVITKSQNSAVPRTSRPIVLQSPKKSFRSKMKSFFSGLMMLASKIFHQKEPSMKA